MDDKLELMDLVGNIGLQIIVANRCFESEEEQPFYMKNTPFMILTDCSEHL